MNYLKDDFIKTGEVLSLVPFSRSTLQKLVKQGKFPQPFKPTENLNLWRKADVMAYLSDNFGGAEHE